MSSSEFIKNIAMMYNKTTLRTMFRDEKLSLPQAMEVMVPPKVFSDEYYKQRIADLNEYFYPKPKDSFS
jgi:hypothetical protein